MRLYHEFLILRIPFPEISTGDLPETIPEIPSPVFSEFLEGVSLSSKINQEWQLIFLQRHLRLTQKFLQCFIEKLFLRFHQELPLGFFLGFLQDLSKNSRSFFFGISQSVRSSIHLRNASGISLTSCLRYSSKNFGGSSRNSFCNFTHYSASFL